MRLDLNSSEFQDALFSLEPSVLRQVMAGLQKLRSLDWNEFQRHPGFRWEAVAGQGTGEPRLHSLRLGRRIRALGFRDGELLRLTSLHPDHDSAYS